METQRVILTVHGIRTFGQWQERLGKLILSANAEVRIEHYHYGYFSIIAFLVPFLRWLATRKFREELASLKQRNPNAEISVVAHSFGTHLLAWGLYGMPSRDRPKIDTVILAGSVLRSSFPWSAFLDCGAVRQVINDCGTSDHVLILSQVFVLLTGMAGRLGFNGITSTRFQNRFFTGGHSLYFLLNGMPDDKFMTDYWVPVLAHEKAPVPYDCRLSQGPIQGVTLTLLQIADPIKLLSYVGIAWIVAKVAWLDPINFKEDQARTATAMSLASGSLQIDAAAAQLASVLIKDSDQRLTGYRKVLSFFLQRLRPVSDIAAELPLNQPITWRGHNYFKKTDGLWRIPGEGVLAYGTTVDQTRAIVLDARNQFYVFRLSDLSLLNKVTLTSNELDVRTHRDPMLEGLDPTANDELIPGEIHGGDSYRILQKSEGKFLILGWHNRGGVKGGMAFFLVDLAQGVSSGAGAGGNGYSGYLSYLSKGCDEIVIQGNAGEYVAHLEPDRTGKIIWKKQRARDMNSNEWYPLPNTYEAPDDAGPFRGCLKAYPTIGGLPNRGELPDLHFPQSVPEETQWDVKISPAILKENANGSDVEAVKLLDEKYESVKDTDVADFFGSISADCHILGGCWIQHWPNSTVIYIASGGSGGSFFTICIFGTTSSIWRCPQYSTPLTDIDRPIVSPDGRLMIVLARNRYSDPGFTLLDLESVSEYRINQLPRSAVQAGFDATSKLFVIKTEKSELWIYSTDDLTRAPIRVPLGHLSDVHSDADEYSIKWNPSMRTRGTSVYTSYAEDSVAAFDIKTGALQWVSRVPSFDGSDLQIAVDDQATMLAVYDGRHIELLSALTGVALTDRFTLPDDVWIREISFDPTGGVSVEATAREGKLIKAIRRPPPALLNIDELARNAQRSTGIDSKTGSTLLDILPEAHR